MRIFQLFLILILLNLLSCTITKRMSFGGNEYRSYFPKEQLAPLKEEVPELYKILKKGELLECINCEEDDWQYLYSIRLNKFIGNNRRLICQSEFLSTLDNFLITFGKKSSVQPDFQREVEIQAFSPNAFLYDLNTDHFGMHRWNFDKDGKLLCQEKYKKKNSINP